MRVKSFLDVLSTDSGYAACSFVELITYEDIVSGDPTGHHCKVLRQDEDQFYIEGCSEEEMEDFRKRVTQHLEGLPNIILIDENRNKIFSNLKEDPFFERLAKNVKDYTGCPPYQLQTLADESLATIIKNTFPKPIKIYERGNNCVVL